MLPNRYPLVRDVERYIAEGEPVGSRTLSRYSGLDLSPATIRNVMSDLEELGLVASPHTSAGRIPTARGYRLFVDTMLTAKRDDLVGTPSLPPANHATGSPEASCWHTPMSPLNRRWR